MVRDEFEIPRRVVVRQEAHSPAPFASLPSCPTCLSPPPRNHPSPYLVVSLMKIITIPITLVAAAALSMPLTAQPRLPVLEELDGDKVSKLLEPDAIPAIDDPMLVAVDEAIFMADAEPVIGIVVNGEARAYSVWHLDYHEIVNDRIEGSAIAVTW